MKSNREVLDWLFETGRINVERPAPFGEAGTRWTQGVRPALGAGTC